MVPARKERSERPRAGRDRRRLAAIAFTDIVGYSILMASDERRTHARWMSILEEIIRPEAARHHGVIVKSTGDGVLAEFPSALDAVEWAQAVQVGVPRSAEPKGAEDLIALRIAIHIGEVVSGRSDIYGDGVNLAARLQEHAPPGGIILSETARELLRGTVGAAARDLGLLRLKNFEGPVRAYALDPPRPALAVPVSTLETTLPSIAVLPFWNLGGDPKNEYFADGVVDDIIMSLAGLRELMVISRASTLFYSGRQPDPREVGRALGVRYVLTGSIRRLGGTVRVSSQLCEAATGAALWAEQMEVGTEELFEVQDRIVSKIVGGIAPNVRSAELQRAMRKRPEVFTAYDCMLRALEVLSKLDRTNFPQARVFLDQAMQHDANFAMPFAWAARWHSINIGQGWSQDWKADAGEAARLALRAIDLDKGNAVALATYGHVRSFLFQECESALFYFDRALSACPNLALAWILSSATMSYLGRGREAIERAERALRLSPFDRDLYVCYGFLAMAHYASGNFEEALRWGRVSASENPGYTSTLRGLIVALAALDRLEEAREIGRRLLAQDPSFRVSIYASITIPFCDPTVREACVAHLRKAELPE
ncbi:MAG: adenylate/guanylate cyclase domain-containing protein [Microvirga sp.]